MNIKINSIQSRQELETAMDLVHSVFMEFEAPDYVEEGIKSFLDYIDYENISSLLEQNKLNIWIAKKDNQIIGVIAMRPTAISLLFVAKQYHRQGVARSLLHYALRYADSETITVNSSPYALKAYQKMGFELTGPEQTTTGIRFQPMQLKRSNYEVNPLIGP